MPNIINQQAKKLLARYLSSQLTDQALHKGYKAITGKDMLAGDEVGFEFMVEGNQLFHKYYNQK